MSHKSRFLLLLVLPLILIACASIKWFPQDKLDEVDRHLIQYLKENQIDYQNITLAKKYPNIQKRQIRVSVIIESSGSLEKFLHAEDLFYNSIISLLRHYFIEVKRGGVMINKQSATDLISHLQKGGDVDAVLVVSDMMPHFTANNTNMYRNLKFTYVFKDFMKEITFSQELAGYAGSKTDLAPPIQKQLLATAILNSTYEIEHKLLDLYDQKFRELQEKMLLAELLAKQKAEQELLLAKLKAKQEQFLRYGFDVLDFVNYAKATLKTRGEINFGGAVPEIDFRTFKEASYLEVKINYLVTYNTLKVSMYDAASMTFDEIVAKLAKKLSTDFKKQDKIAGFIFNVTYTVTCRCGLWITFTTIEFQRLISNATVLHLLNAIDTLRWVRLSNDNE